MDYFDPEARRLEKQQSREEDLRALATGEKTSEQLKRENALFAFGKGQAKLVLGRPAVRMR